MAGDLVGGEEFGDVVGEFSGDIGGGVFDDDFTVGEGRGVDHEVEDDFVTFEVLDGALFDVVAKG